MYEWRRAQVARAILDYLRKHPEAQDTLAGITEWWLPEQQIKTQTGTVKVAIAELVARGLILQRKGRDSQIHYRVNRRRLKEIKAAFLKEPDRT